MCRTEVSTFTLVHRSPIIRLNSDGPTSWHLTLAAKLGRNTLADFGLRNLGAVNCFHAAHPMQFNDVDTTLGHTIRNWTGLALWKDMGQYLGWRLTILR